MQYRKGGILKLALSRKPIKGILVACISQPTVKWLEAEDVRESEKAIAPNLLGAAFIEDDVNVLPIAVCQGFCEKCPSAWCIYF